MTTYMICDGNGNALTDGLQAHEAAMTAQRMADARAESVWLSASDDEGLGDEIEPDEEKAIVAAKVQLDAWDPDDPDEATTIPLLFWEIYGRSPDNDENAVDLIYAARNVLEEDDARGVLRVLWPNWPGFSA